MRGAFACLIVFPATLSQAQTPDTMIKIDVALTYRNDTGNDQTLRWYDAMGRFSTVGLVFKLEPGFTALVSEKLQRIDNDGDTEQLDQYYVEDPGNWRFGKQYLPFGRNVLFNESGRAARGDTTLFIEGLPLAVALCDNGKDRPRGVIGRLGGRLGLSFAYGEHFGISGSALTPIRLPEDAPGVGRGYRTLVGLDGSRRFGLWSVQGEVMSLRGGATQADRDLLASDLMFSYRPYRKSSVAVAWSRNWSDRQDFFRLEGKLGLTDTLLFEPLLRISGRRVLSFGASLRFKI